MARRTAGFLIGTVLSLTQITKLAGGKRRLIKCYMLKNTASAHGFWGHRFTGKARTTGVDKTTQRRAERLEKQHSQESVQAKEVTSVRASVSCTFDTEVLSS